MSAPIQTGGPAFPRPDFHSDTHFTSPAQNGMDLRDYFAAQALNAMMSNPSLVDPLSTHAVISKTAYLLANAMLKAREIAS